MEHMQLVIKNPERAFHTFAMPESTASSAHTIFVCPPSGNRIEVTIPPGKLPGDLFTVMLKDEDAYPPSGLGVARGAARGARALRAAAVGGAVAGGGGGGGGEPKPRERRSQRGAREAAEGRAAACIP